MLTKAKLVLTGLAIIAIPVQVVNAEESCSSFWVTAYTSSDYPGRTADGTPTIGNEWALVAVHSNRGVPRFPYGSMLLIHELGTFRVADTGMLRYNHLDVLVHTRAEAYSITGNYVACWN